MYKQYDYNCNMEDSMVMEPMESLMALNATKQPEKQSYSFASPMSDIPLEPVLLDQSAMYHGPNNQAEMGMPLPYIMPVHRYPFPPMAGNSFPMNYRKAPKRVKFIVIFDWDDTLFPTTAIQQSPSGAMNVEELCKFGKSVYELLEKYIHHFGVDNMRIVTNGTKSWVFKSLKMASDLYRGYFDGATNGMEQKGRDQDYFAAIYNSIVSARDEYAERYPQVKHRSDYLSIPFH